MEPNYQHEVKRIAASEIRLNNYNPNVVSPELLDQLEKRIREDGFLQPILVRHIEPKGGKKYEMIDGAHRYEVAVNRIGYKELPAIITDKNLPDAMIATINMNKLRGEFDTLKLAEVIHELHKTYTMEELEDQLGYSGEELTGLDELLDFDFDQYDEKEMKLSDQAPEDYRFEVVVTRKQYKIIEKAIENTKEEDNAVGITKICLVYLTEHVKTKRTQ